MKQGQNIDLGMTGLDELFMTDAQRQEKKMPKIQEIPLELIDEFPDHPFKVRMDDDMRDLISSIKEQGLITPIILRPKDDGRYEVVSGHRRKKACELAGHQEIKAEVRDLTRDEAIIMMVDANLQRTEILPSEKAKAYKMRLDAMNRQGLRSDLTFGPLGQKLQNINSREELAKYVPDSARQIQRYIRLNELIPELVQVVDDGRMGLRPAIEISYIGVDEQKMISKDIEFYDATPSHAQAKRMRVLYNEGRLDREAINQIMSEEKPNQKEKINLKYAEARKYIPSDVPYSKTPEYIMMVLQANYQREKRRAERDSR